MEAVTNSPGSIVTISQNRRCHSTSWRQVYVSNLVVSPIAKSKCNMKSKLGSTRDHATLNLGEGSMRWIEFHKASSAIWVRS
jgi:hypothetical protein